VVVFHDLAPADARGSSGGWFIQGS
jgi:hypothetical protein